MIFGRLCCLAILVLINTEYVLGPTQVDDKFRIARVEDNDAEMFTTMKAAVAALPADQRPKMMMSIGGWSMSRSDGPVFGEPAALLISLVVIRLAVSHLFITTACVHAGAVCNQAVICIAASCSICRAHGSCRPLSQGRAVLVAPDLSGLGKHSSQPGPICAKRHQLCQD